MEASGEKRMSFEHREAERTYVITSGFASSTVTAVTQATVDVVSDAARLICLPPAPLCLRQFQGVMLIIGPESHRDVILLLRP